MSNTDPNSKPAAATSGKWWPVGAALVVLIGAFVVWTNGFPIGAKPHWQNAQNQHRTDEANGVVPPDAAETDLSELKRAVWQLFEQSANRSREVDKNSGPQEGDANQSTNESVGHRRIQQLFAQILESGVTADAIQSWAELDFSVHEFSAANQTMIAISEDKQKSGRGLFVFRTSAAVPIALQAPHRFYDSRSGDIALAAFLESSCSAFCCNTIHRRKIDWAHATQETTCNAFTRAFANVFPHGLVVQVHGFASSKRKSKSGRQSDVILSHGTRFPPVWTLRARHIFRQALPEFQISLFPEDTPDLGAETNVQGRLLRSHDGFLHVELDFDVREKLQSDETTRRRVFDTGLEQLYEIRKMDGSR